MFMQDAWVIANDESSCLGIFYVNQEGGIVSDDGSKRWGCGRASCPLLD
jgi:hypothetical protein